MNIPQVKRHDSPLLKSSTVIFFSHLIGKQYVCVKLAGPIYSIDTILSLSPEMDVRPL